MAGLGAQQDYGELRLPPPSEWFLGEIGAEYEVWSGMGTVRDARLFIAKDSRVAYFSHFQL